MARGWESKSVEDQVQQSETTKGQTKKAELTPKQLELRRRKEVLRLSRARVERELQASQNPRYREQLHRALADLDAQIAKLPEPS
jgi:hypothetical protein